MLDAIKFKLLTDVYCASFQMIGDLDALTACAQLRFGGMQYSGNIGELAAYGKDETDQHRVS